MHIPLRTKVRGTVLAVALALAGCGSMSERERTTAQGAGVGAAAGAVIGGVTGGSATRGAVIGGAVGAVAGNLWGKRMEDRRERVAKASAGSGVAVGRTADDRLRVTLPADASFAPGSAAITPAMRPTLDELSRTLDAGTRVTVVGYTDASGSDSANQALALARAESVRNYLAARGVDPSRIDVEGRGAREPVSANDSDAGRALNRRVEILVSDRAAG